MNGNAVLLALTAIALYAPAAYSTSLRGQTRLLESMMLGPPVCLIENGFDYVGHDLSNAPGTVNDCCNICSWTFGCKAWSWSGYNSGTCWLKSGRGDIVVNPDVKSALNPTVSSSYCELSNDLDLIGNDIARVDSKTAEGCCDLCQKYPGCRAYAWSDYLGGSCWLKSKAGQNVYKIGVKSGKAYPDLTPSCSTLEVGIDYVDNDIGNQPGKTPETCCDICKATNRCRAFSWTDQNGGTCWLKNLKGNAVYKQGVISSQVYPNPDPQCTLKQDTDYVDNDMGYVPSTDPLLCCSICRERSGCKAFAWSNFNGGTCWLKTAAGVPVPKSGVLSTTI